MSELKIGTNKFIVDIISCNIRLSNNLRKVVDLSFSFAEEFLDYFRSCSINPYEAPQICFSYYKNSCICNECSVQSISISELDEYKKVGRGCIVFSTTSIAVIDYNEYSYIE